MREGGKEGRKEGRKKGGREKKRKWDWEVEKKKEKEEKKWWKVETKENGRREGDRPLETYSGTRQMYVSHHLMTIVTKSNICSTITFLHLTKDIRNMEHGIESKTV